MTRQIVLDTETTGLEPSEGHRIIEIGCVEMQERRLSQNNYHQYLQPDRLIDAGAMEVHGITNEQLVEMPRFAAIADEFYDYIKGAELIIHNAPFDVAFIEHEFKLLGRDVDLSKICQGVNNTHRTLHGALLDSEILADVYLYMTGGQEALSLDVDESTQGSEHRTPIAELGLNLPVVKASEKELENHESNLQRIDKACGEKTAWRKHFSAGA